MALGGYGHCPMSAIANLVDAVLAESLVPALRAAGYRRAARTWRRVGPATTRVVNVQGSAWNSADEGRFTINLGLYFPALAPFVGWGRTAERPTEPDCQVRMRIGFLLPGGLDHWWTITPATDIIVLAGEVRDAWVRYGAHWMETYDDLEAARPLVAKQYAYGAAAVSLALGDRAEAERLVRDALAATSHRRQAEGIRVWARQHGLSVAAA
jgi:hypothetical protein